MNILGVIPARGGSKGIPRKNIQPLAGRPLLEYTIGAARGSRYLNRLVVSTDDAEIQAVAEALGVHVIQRPAQYSTDSSRTEAALLHVCDVLLQEERYEPELVVTLEPTSPLRSSALIDRCIETLLARPDGDSLLTVTETRACYGRLREGRFEYLFPGQPRRRQEREPLYKESSTVYVTRTGTLRAKQSVLGDRLYAVVAEEGEAIDINTPLDLAIAEAIVLRRREGGRHDQAG